MKRVFIVHGWGGKPEQGFKPWLKQELEARGYSAEVPAMPETDNPRIDAWASELQKVIVRPDEDTVLVGHSLGAPAILHYIPLSSEKVFKERLGGRTIIEHAMGHYSSDTGVTEVPIVLEEITG